MWSKNNDVVRDAALTTPNAYVQVVGIVQALAVVLLLQEGALFDLLNEGGADLGSAGFWVAFFQATVAFQLIVLVWHVYVQSSTAFQRILGVADSYIAFSFLLVEFFIVMNSVPAKFSAWAISVGLFMLAAIVAYLQFFTRAKRDFEESRAAFDRIGNYPLIVYAFLVVLGTVALSGYVFNVSDPVSQAMLAGAIDVSLLGFTVIHVRLFWGPIVRAERLRKPFSPHPDAM